jgi:hypothetical protein
LTIGAIAPFVFISTQLGIAQGKEFYLKLAGIYIVFGIVCPWTVFKVLMVLMVFIRKTMKNI